VNLVASVVVLAVTFSSFLVLARCRRSSCCWSFSADPSRTDICKDSYLLCKDSYLLRWTEVLCYYLQWLSPATWRFGTRAASHNTARLKREERERARFVDAVVFAWVVACVAALSVAFRPRWQYSSDVICTLAVLRVADIVQAQVNAHLWDPLRVKRPKEEYVLSLQRSLLLAGINYIELIGWFTAIYATFEVVCKAHNLGDYLYFSAVTQLTIGYGDLLPICVARILAPLQAMLGTMLLVLGVARLVAGIRAPTRS
jgi:hypothetical protein